MKKFFAIALAVAMFASMATVVSAAENTTTLTTTVPAATYTLNVPAVVPIDFGATSTDIGNVTVTDATGFAEGKNLKVTVTYGAFTSEGAATSIPFVLKTKHSVINPTDESKLYCDLASNNAITFLGKEDTTVKEYSYNYNDSSFEFKNQLVSSLFVSINSSDWSKALAGEYTATITYTAEVVVEE